MTELTLKIQILQTDYQDYHYYNNTKFQDSIPVDLFPRERERERERGGVICMLLIEVI